MPEDTFLLCQIQTAIVGGLIGTATPDKDGLISKLFASKIVNYKDIYRKILRIDSPCILYFNHYYEQRLIVIAIGEVNSYTILHKTSRTYRLEGDILTNGNNVAIKGVGNNVGGSTNFILIPLGSKITLTEIEDSGYSTMP